MVKVCVFLLSILMDVGASLYVFCLNKSQQSVL